MVDSPEVRGEEDVGDEREEGRKTAKEEGVGDEVADVVEEEGEEEEGEEGCAVVFGSLSKCFPNIFVRNRERDEFDFVFSSPSN